MEQKKSTSIPALVLGIVGLILSVLPCVGLILCIVGLILGVKGIGSKKKGMGIAGTILSGVGLFASIVYTIIGIIMALGTGIGVLGTGASFFAVLAANKDALMESYNPDTMSFSYSYNSDDEYATDDYGNDNYDYDYSYTNDEMYDFSYDYDKYNNSDDYAYGDELPLNEFEESEYIFYDSDERYLTEAEVEMLSEEELRIAINEIYARLGRKFNDEALQEYFNSLSWYVPIYTPEDFDKMGNGIFNDYEWENIQLLSKYRDQKR